MMCGRGSIRGSWSAIDISAAPSSTTRTRTTRNNNLDTTRRAKDGRRRGESVGSTNAGGTSSTRGGANGKSSTSESFGEIETVDGSGARAGNGTCGRAGGGDVTGIEAGREGSGGGAEDFVAGGRSPRSASSNKACGDT